MFFSTIDTPYPDNNGLQQQGDLLIIKVTYRVVSGTFYYVNWHIFIKQWEVSCFISPCQHASDC